MGPAGLDYFETVFETLKPYRISQKHSLSLANLRQVGWRASASSLYFSGLGEFSVRRMNFLHKQKRILNCEAVITLPPKEAKTHSS